MRRRHYLRNGNEENVQFKTLISHLEFWLQPRTVDVVTVPLEKTVRQSNLVMTTHAIHQAKSVCRKPEYGDNALPHNQKSRIK